PVITFLKRATIKSGSFAKKRRTPVDIYPLACSLLVRNRTFFPLGHEKPLFPMTSANEKPEISGSNP
ncbi:MAG: hypothetical protein ACI4QT_09250, partial [Kiritimatiellia bacterium]